MPVQLPEAFVERMKHLLGERFPDFLASYDEPRYYGLRVNTLKIPAERFLSISPFSLSPVPWVKEGFYYTEADRPGKHPYYHAGLYYIQEPSAMAPVELLDVHPGDKVLDLCAAPGGKSTQIAAKLQNEGILVANDHHPDRAKALVKNLELAGVRNAVVLNETPQNIARSFKNYFNKVLIDAPCSGEGMFRKEEEMAKSWEKHSVEKCVLMQRDILNHAAELVAPGGRIVYSTCTFAPEENEARIAEFLDSHPDFHVVPVQPEHGFASGKPEWLKDVAAAGSFSDDALQAVSGTVRLWPHLLHGEGHYAAVLERTMEDFDALQEGGKAGGDTHQEGRQAAGARQQEAGQAAGAAKQKQPHAFESMFEFFDEHGISTIEGNWTAYGDHFFAGPIGLPSLERLNVLRPGWYIGTAKKNRFVPSHALAMGLTTGEVNRTLALASDSPECIRYLKGETLEMDESRIEVKHCGAKGYCLVHIDGFPAGWGKWMQGILKNEYPPAWRWT